MSYNNLTNAEVAHVWAQQRRDNDGSLIRGESSNGNFSFAQRALFSYSTIMAVFLEYKGQTYVFENRETYSMTTSSKHQSQIQSRIFPSDVKIIPVYNAGDSRLGNFIASDRIIDSLNCQGNQYMTNKDQTETIRRNVARVVEGLIEKGVESHKKIKRARTYKDMHIADSARFLELARELTETFNIKSRVKIPVDLDEYVSGAQKRINAAKKAQEKRRAKIIAAQKIKDQEAFEKWLSGEGHSCPRSYAVNENGGCYMRVTHGEKPMLETSQNVRVDLQDALKVFRFVKLVKQRGKRWVKNGQRIPVGHYQVDVIKDNGDMIAGCHTFIYADMQAIAATLTDDTTAKDLF